MYSTMQKYIDYLIKKYNTEKIEIALVQLFTDINAIIVKNNLIIKSILSVKDNEIKEIKEFLFIKDNHDNLICQLSSFNGAKFYI